MSETQQQEVPTEITLAAGFVDSLRKHARVGVVPFARPQEEFGFRAAHPKPPFQNPHEQWRAAVTTGISELEFDLAGLAERGHVIPVTPQHNICPHQVIRTALAAVVEAYLKAPMDEQCHLSISAEGFHYQNLPRCVTFAP